jgi:NAD(P)-dependent dehydrogenase (short-subunit alcohol dehydrogenase family)
MRDVAHSRTISSRMVPFLPIDDAVPRLKRAGGGSVIVTASIDGTRVFSNTGATAYSASKAGQVAITKMLALELAKHRIRVNVVCPGGITTDMEERTETRDLETAQEPAALRSGDASRHVTGTEIFIDGAHAPLIG